MGEGCLCFGDVIVHLLSVLCWQSTSFAFLANLLKEDDLDPQHWRFASLLSMSPLVECSYCRQFKPQPQMISALAKWDSESLCLFLLHGLPTQGWTFSINVGDDHNSWSLRKPMRPCGYRVPSFKLGRWEETCWSRALQVYFASLT